MRRGHRKSKEAKKPLPVKSLTSAGISAVLLLMLIAFFTFASSTNEPIPRIIGGLSFLCLIASIYNVVKSLTYIKNNNFDLALRIACVAICVVNALAWVAVYFIGIFGMPF